MLGKIVGNAVKVILPIDSAIEGGSYDDYRASGYDESRLKLKQGDEPCRFLIRQLTDGQWDFVGAHMGMRRGVKAVIRCGCLDFGAYAIRKPDGSTGSAGKPETENAGEAGTIITEKWLADLNMPAEHLAALASEIKAYSGASLPLSEQSEPPSGEQNGSEKESGS